MGKDELVEMMKSLQLNKKIEYDSIPNLDLYMDQVITLFEDKLDHTKRYEKDKLLTKTMINNYIKDKLMMPAYKKKYTKDHVVLMILLYQLKQILSISDIKALFSTIVQDGNVDSDLLKQIYQIYLDANTANGEAFMNEATVIHEYVQSHTEVVDELSKGNAEQINDMIEIMLLTQKAQYYKRLAEKKIDRTLALQQG